MSESQNKKLKTYHNAKNKNFYVQKGKRNFIECGQRGFLATCNFREKDCVRECYNILNQYADELYGPQNKDKPEATEPDKELDITDELQKNIDDAKAEMKEQKFRFQMVNTGTNNCIFIKTTLPNPVELGEKIVKDIAKTKAQKTRFLLRLVPVEVVCRANTKDIVDAAGALFDRYFLKEPHTFSIVFNKRYNNDVKRDDIIKELAELVASKNVNNKVDLKNSELCVLVEVIKGLCCLSVLPQYLQLKKYNLIELAAKPAQETASVVSSTEGDDAGKEEKVTEEEEKVTDDTDEKQEEKIEDKPDEDIK